MHGSQANTSARVRVVACWSSAAVRWPNYKLPPSDVTPVTVSSRRQLKAAEAIREVVAMSILTDLRDPRVRDVTVLGVEVTADMREAKVSVSVMGDEAQQALSLRGLQNSAGFLQSKIADKIETRYIPRLQFVLDQGVKNVVAVGEILDRIRQEKEADSSPAAAQQADDHRSADSFTEDADDGTRDAAQSDESAPPAS
jgi:ribosome-binding factor A